MRASLVVLFFLFLALLPASMSGNAPQAPYPPSEVIESITWDWSTFSKRFVSSDLWPMTWGDDGHLYTAWGDGFGFGDKRVSQGVARVEGFPPDHQGVNINTTTWDCKGCGKAHGILMVDGVLYMWLDMQKKKPSLRAKLAWSYDRGVTWQLSDWWFESLDFAPGTFLQYGKNYAGATDEYVYFYGGKGGFDPAKEAYLGRVSKDKLQNKESYEYFTGIRAKGNALWSKRLEDRKPVFFNPKAREIQFGWHVQAVYNPGIRRYILTSFHAGPGGLGVYEGPNPWGPWHTIYYADNFAGMKTKGYGLNSTFPQKWMSENGLTLWNVVSVWGEGGKQGQNMHDHFNVVQATLKLK